MSRSGGAGAAMREAIGSGVTAADYERSLRRHVQSFPESPAPSPRAEVYSSNSRASRPGESERPQQRHHTLVDAIAKQPSSLSAAHPVRRPPTGDGRLEACVKELSAAAAAGDPERASTWRDLAETFGSMGLEDPKARAKEVRA